MRNTKYDKIADNYKAEETKGRNALIAFIVGVTNVIPCIGEIKKQTPCANCVKKHEFVVSCFLFSTIQS